MCWLGMQDAVDPSPRRRSEMPAKTVSKGETLSCTTCGLVLVVDEVCGCAEAHEVICCEQPMQPARAKPKVKAKAPVRKKAAAKA